MGKFVSLDVTAPGLRLACAQPAFLGLKAAGHGFLASINMSQFT